MSYSEERCQAVLRRFYPEVAAGGFTRVDGAVEFYQRVRALVSPEHIVVDLGAGRGRFLHDEKRTYLRNLRLLRGYVRQVIGLDVDPVVLKNAAVDSAHVITPPEPFPLADCSIDIVVSDFTLEHIDDPAWVSAELRRVVKHGGWICARTPNKWGMIGIAARIVPNRLHSAVLRVLQPGKEARDTFRTTYRMNTAREIRRYFPDKYFDVYCYTYESHPAYAAASVLGWRAFRMVSRLTPERFGSMLLIFIRKKDPGA